MTLFERIKKRAMFQWAAAYIAGAWLLLEILGFMADTFTWPQAIVRGASVALAVGFVVALVLAWFHGEKGRQRASGTELLIIAALLGVGGFLVTVLAPTPEPLSAAERLLPQGEDRGKSIAVLPFSNLSAGEENTFLASGIQTSVETRLSKINELRVLTAVATLPYRDSDLPLRQIADELAVGAFLQGSVQRLGDQLRISVILIDAETGGTTWGEDFDGTMDQAFEFQSDVALQVAERLQATLGPSERAAVITPSTANVEAQEFFMRARAMDAQRTREAHEEAIRLYRLALDSDPDFAEGWAGLGSSYIYLVQSYGYDRSWIDTAEVYGRRAIALDSADASGYGLMGGVEFLRGRNAGAKEWWSRALEAQPGLQTAVANSALANLFTGDWAQALRRAKEAFRLDPRSPRIRELLANSYQDLMEFDIARRWLEEALEREPQSPAVRRQEQALHILSGDPVEGYRRFETFVAESGVENAYVSTVAATGAHFARNFEDVLEWTAMALEQAEGGVLRDYQDVRIARAFALSRDGLTPEAMELLARAERDYRLPVELGADSWMFPLFLSHVSLTRGALDEGLEWFEEANARGFNGWYVVEQDPIFDVVRDDSRYREIIAQMRGRIEVYRAAIQAEEEAAGER